jgi:hypothetical protein
MRYDENQEVVGTVWPGYWYLVDGVPRQPEVIMDVKEWKRRLQCQRITFCDVDARELRPEHSLRSPYEDDDGPF